MDFKTITLKDKELFDRYFSAAQPEISEMTFTNLFMWRNFYNVKYSVIEDLLCILSFPDRGGAFAFMPVGDVTPEKLGKAVAKLRKYFNSLGFPLVFKRVSERDAELLKPYAARGGIIFDRDNSDYVYFTENLVSLKGKKYHAKRNHINKFLRLYEYEYVIMRPEHIDECKKIMEKWCSERDCEEHRDLYCEKIANFELLDIFEELGCKGALIKVNGEFEAFTVGELLNDETVVIHIEKANSRIEGLYAFINQQFLMNEWSGTKYVNREQDLGIEGLRKAKLSYNPDRFVNKYTVNIE